MSDAYKVSVILELTDKLSSELGNVTKALGDAQKLFAKLAPNLSELSKKGTTLADSLNNSVKAIHSLGKSEGLVEVSKRMDKLAESSAKLAQNMQEATKARMSGGESDKADDKDDDKKESSFSKIRDKAVDKAKDWTVDGVKDNFDLQDTNFSIARSFGTLPDQLGKTSELLRKQEADMAAKVGYATNGEFKQVAEAREAVASTNGSKAEQDEMFEAVMPYSANIARQNGIGLKESTEGFVEIAENAGIKGKEVIPLFNAVGMAIHTTGVKLDALTEGMSGASGALKASGKNINDTVLLIATLKSKKLLDADGADMLNEMAKAPLAEHLDGKSAKDKEKLEAATKLGLYKDGHAQFFKNGQVDLLQEFALLAKAKHEDPKEFDKAFKTLYGSDKSLGKPLAKMLDKANPGTLMTLSELPEKKQNEKFLEDDAKVKSANEKLHQISVNAGAALSNATAGLSSFVDSLLDLGVTFSEGAAKFTQEHSTMSMTVLGTVASLGAFAKVKAGLGTMKKALDTLKGGKAVAEAAEGVEAAAGTEAGAATVGAAETAAAGTGTAAAGGELAGVAATEAAAAGAAETGAIAAGGTVAAGGTIAAGTMAAGALGAGAVGYIVGTVLNDQLSKKLSAAAGKDETLGTMAWECMHPDKKTEAQPFDVNDPKLQAIYGKDRLTKMLEKLHQDQAKREAKLNEMLERTRTQNSNPVVNAHVYVDGKEIAAHIVPSLTQGTTGMNLSSGNHGTNITPVGLG